MPNHVTNAWTITGPANEIKRLFIEKEFTFNDVIPPPANLHDIDEAADYCRNRALYELLTGNIHADHTWLHDAKDSGYRILTWARGSDSKMVADTFRSLTDPASLAAYFAIHAPAGFVKGLFDSKELHDKTGASWWYDWNVKYWGTKWDCYDVNVSDPWESGDGRLSVQLNFNTAWSLPQPVILKLVDMGFSIEGAWFDEAWCHCGRIVGSQIVSVDCNPSNPEALSLYQDVYGEAYEPEPEPDEINTDSEESQP